MITSVDERNKLIIFINVLLFTSTILTGIFVDRFSFYSTLLDGFVSFNLFLIVSILLADKYETNSMLIVIMIIHGIIFDLAYVNTIGVYTLYVVLATLLTSIFMKVYSNTIFVRLFVFFILIFLKEMYLYVIYYIVNLKTFYFSEVVASSVYSTAYNVLIFLVIYQILMKLRIYRDYTNSNI